jgi:uncharacterized membrane protein YdfJ with MMPL/SSD domain
MATEQATRKTTEHPREGAEREEAVAAEWDRKTTTPAGLTARAARRSAAHRRTAVLGWLAFVLVAFAVGSAVGVVYLKDEEFGIGDSHGAEKVLAREFPTERATEEVLTAQDRVGPALGATAAVQRAHPQLLIGQVGDASATKAVSDRIADDFQRAEVTSLPVTLVILVLAFGALVAAGIPLLLGLTAVMAALGLTALFSHLLHVHESINSVILLIGLAVGIDYSLFYLRRYRAERALGRPPAVLLPATMALLGDWNWYLPRWLQWLPQPRGEALATPTETELERPGRGGTVINVTSSKEGLR